MNYKTFSTFNILLVPSPIDIKFSHRTDRTTGMEKQTTFDLTESNYGGHYRNK